MPIPYKLIRSKRRTISLQIKPGGELVVRAPLRLAKAHIQQFVEAHQEWIERSRSKVLAQPRPAPRRFENGEPFPYLGKSYPLAVVHRDRPALDLAGSQFHLAQSSQPQAAALFERWYREQARQVIGERLSALASQHSFRYTKLRISSARTRWGSCSRAGTLSFTWRLILAPPDVLDYVILHELAHLRHPNHSKAFWAEVARLCPQYAVHRRWLKDNGRPLIQFELSQEQT